MSTTHRCLVWAVTGLALGLSWAAWAQPAEPAALDPSATALVELAKVVGLPGVLAFLGFKAGRMFERITISVRLHDDDRRLLQELARGCPQAEHDA